MKRVSFKLSVAAALALGTTASFGAIGDYFVDLPNGDWVLVGVPGFAEPSEEVTPCQDMNASGLQVAFDLNSNVSDTTLSTKCFALAETDYNDSQRVSSVDLNTSLYFVDIFAVSSDNAFDTNMSEWTGDTTDIDNNPTIVFDPIEQTTFGSGKSMFVRVSDDSDYTDLIQIRFDDKYTGEKFNLSVDGNDTFYQYTFGPNKTVYLESTSSDSSKTSEDYGVYLNIDMNKSKGGMQYFNEDVNGSDSGDMDAIALTSVDGLLEHNLSVWTFENKVWRKFQTLSGNNVVKDFNVTTAGASYWYQLDADDYATKTSTATGADEAVIVLADQTLSSDDINFSTEGDGEWIFTALPTGQFINSQVAMYSRCLDLAKISNLYNEELNVSDYPGTINLTNSQGSRILNGIIRKALYQDDNNTAELTVRAYPATQFQAAGGTTTGTLLVADRDFNITCDGSPATTSIAGTNFGSRYGVYGEQAIIFHVNKDLLSDINGSTGSITIEIPNLSSDEFEVNLSNISSLSILESNITRILRGKAQHSWDEVRDEALNANDFNITRADLNFDGVYDDFIIAIKTPEFRTGTYLGGNDNLDYTNEYLRMGVREDSYVKIYEVNATYDFNITKTIMKPTSLLSTALTGDDKGQFSIQLNDLEIGRASIVRTDLDTKGGVNAIDINVTKTRTGYQYEYNMTTSYIEINNNKQTTSNPDTNQTAFLYFITNNRFIDIFEENATSYAGGRYVPGDSNESFRVLKNITFDIDTNVDRDDAYTTTRYGEDVQIDTNKSRGVIAEVYTLQDLAGDSVTINGTTDGNSTEITPTIYDLKANTVWSAGMPNTGPLYELATAGIFPKEVWTYKNKRWFDVKFDKDPTTWLNDFTLFRVGAVDGFWVKIDQSGYTASLTEPTVNPDETSITLVSHYDVLAGTSYNVPFVDQSIEDVESSLSTFFDSVDNKSDEKLLLNISVAGSAAAGYFESVGNVGAYHVSVDPYTFNGEFSNTAGTTALAAQSVTLSDGVTEITAGTSLGLSSTKPAAPAASLDITTNTLSFTKSNSIEIYKGFINDANVTDTQLVDSDSIDSYTILPTDMNITDWTSSLEMNLTKLLVVTADADDFKSDIESFEYLPLFSMKWGTVANGDITKDTGDHRYLLTPTSGDDSNLTLIDEEGYKVGNSATSSSSDYLINLLNIVQTAGSTDYVYTATRYITDEEGTTLATAATSYTDDGTTYTVDSTNSNGIQVKSLVSGASVSLAYKPEPGLTSGNTPSSNFYTFYDANTSDPSNDRVAIATISFPDDYNGSKFFLYYDNNNTIYSGMFHLGNSGLGGNVGWGSGGSTTTTDSNLTTVKASSTFSF